MKALINKHARVIKYIISGGTAALVDLSTFYLFSHVLNLWYILSATLSFLIAFGFSFTLQKYWTFSDKTSDGVHKQAASYFVASVINLLVTLLLMYVFVDLFHFIKIYAKILTSGLVAVGSYFVYKHLIFKKA